jgi:perosamine synthetase
MDLVPVSRPSIGNEELNGISEVFESGWLGLGAQVLELEQELQKFLGARNVVCTNTGTTALHLALDVLGLKRGDEVLVPAFTYVATTQAIAATGAKPVFCDINGDDLNIDPAEIKKKLTRKTKVILPVHYRGYPCNMDEIRELADEYTCFVVEDAAHAFGSKYKGKMIGSFGDATCFSFDPIKNMTCGEGGAVAFQDQSLLERMQQKRILGIDKDTWSRYRNERSWFYDVVTSGYRYHMSNINAAIGLVQLKKFDAMNRCKIEVARRYDEAFSNIPGITLLRNDNYRDIGLFIYVIRIEKCRNELMDHLTSLAVGSGIHYIPSHLFTYYRKRRLSLPITDRVYGEILTLPLFPDITDEQVNRVINAIRTGIHSKNII